MGTVIKSSTGKKYELEPRDSSGWRVSRLDSNSNKIVSVENVAESLVSRTKKRLEAGETIKFRDIDYTVAKETAVVYLLKDIIQIDEDKKTYSLIKGSSVRKTSYSWKIISSNVVLKYIDKSLYSQGTVVPKELYSFFKLEDMDHGEKGEIYFFRNNKLHNCQKQRYPDRSGRRIFWDSDLKKDIKKEFNEIFLKLSNDQDSNSTFSKDGYLRFEKIKDNIHISFSKKTEREDIIGEIEGVIEGQTFENRRELHDANVHRGLMRGIGARGESIVLSGGYVDDQDNGDEIIYTGEGGRDPNTGLQVSDQTLTGGNLALFNHYREGNPIRVSRGSNADSRFAPPTGYKYGGLYRIENVWGDIGRDGYKIWRYKFIKLSNSEIITPTITAAPPQGLRITQRTQVTTSRIIRSSAIGNYVKRLYDYTCQISGVQLDTPNGPYAEACHIQPVGKPHNGPDEVSNVLCLSPNMHVLFDLGAISIDDDLRLIGMKGKLTLKDEHDLSKEAIRYHRDRIFRE